MQNKWVHSGIESDMARSLRKGNSFVRKKAYDVWIRPLALYGELHGDR